MEWYQKLGLKFPLFQGGMAWASNPELVAAVSNAGGLGIIGSGGRSAEQLQQMIQKTRQITDKPFGVNLMLLEDNIAELIEVIFQEKIPVITTGAGNPKKYLENLKKHNVQVFPVVPNAKIARKMLQLPIAGLIVEGLEAGGHVGTETTFTLVPQIAKLTTLPILAAGGIYDHTTYEAAKAMGAIGVQIGTAFLLAKECQISPIYKQKIIASQNPGTKLAKTASGYYARVLKNVAETTNQSLKAAVQKGDIKTGAFMAGQIADSIDAEMSAEKIVNRIMF